MNLDEVQPQILIPEERIAIRVRELARRLEEDYRNRTPLLLVGVLTGAWIFLADLVRQLSLPVECDFLRASSYGDSHESSGRVEFLIPPSLELEGRHVVVVEDLMDTGYSVQAIRRELLMRNPLSLAFLVLLDKPSRREVEESADYVGFVIPDRFVVGYGMDYGGRFRHLPHVGYLSLPDDPPLEESFRVPSGFA